MGLSLIRDSSLGATNARPFSRAVAHKHSVPVRGGGLILAGIVAVAACSGPTGDDPPNGGDGKVLWHVQQYGARGRVAATSDLVYFPGRTHDVIAVRKSSGEVAWRATTPTQSAETMGFGLAVAGDVVVFADLNLYAFDRTSGAFRWVFTGGGSNPAQSVPVAAQERVFSGSTTGTVFAIRAWDGTELWNAPAPFAGLFFANNPTIAGDTLIVGYAERFPGWRGGLAAFDVASGALLWTRDFSPLVTAGKLARCLGNAVVDSTRVYAWLERGDVVALDRQTGEIRWHRLPTGTDQGNWRQMSLARQTLVVASFDGHFEGINPTNGDLIWTKIGDLGSVLQPTSSDGESVYAIGSGALAAINPSDGSSRWVFGNAQPSYALYGTPAFDSQAVYIGGNGLWAVRK